ncbi:hypothetical protein TGAM01_v204391 [Trichoderma gamsii]|uniref:Uncharacterized protein n=1 Tax=Trichoderma gamsii TaxID=398673 RepID=A0A2P4ZRG0_9HYPO|nr:hypothetical protein TGAM01_v204391 [Trichoderma gamsii]PON26890.1 hypothetical protein TGAM01_v204391 [Trichoderma gamsii]
MKFSLALFVGVAVAAPSLQIRQTDGCAIYETCFQFPLPCPSGHVSKEVNGCYTCCLVG